MGTIASFQANPTGQARSDVTYPCSRPVTNSEAAVFENRQATPLELATGAATGVVGSGYGVAVKGAATRLVASTAVEPTYIVSGNAARMAEVRAAGNAGEVAAGIVKNTKRIPAPSGSASFRIPDELTASRLGEVKNVASLRWADQLSDFLSYSSTRGLDFVIYVRRSTRLDSTLTNLEREGRIKIDR